MSCTYCIVCGIPSSTKACNNCISFWERARDKYSDSLAGRGPKVDFTDDWDRTKGITISKEEQRRRFALHISNLWEKRKGICFYTGYPMFKDDSTKAELLTEFQKQQNFSVDRKNGGIYEPGNIVLCMNIANTMKNIFNQNDFDIIVYEIVKNRIKERRDLVNMIGQLYESEIGIETKDFNDLVEKTNNSQETKFNNFVAKIKNIFKR